MEQNNLRCNIPTCRESVGKENKAVITNCSHILCLACANSSSSLVDYESHPICPVCNSPLLEPEDIVCTSLNPTSDYKSSVLSGLPPSTILDIASRALKFWDYQQSVEASFQKSVAKQAQEKAALLVQEKLNFKAQAKNEIKVLVRRLRQTENALSLEKQRAMEASDLPTTARIGKRRPEESRQSFPGVGQGHFDLRGAPGNPNIPGRYVGSITPVKSVGHHSDYYGRPQDNIRRAGAGKPHREFMSRTGYGPNETDHRFRMFAEPAGFDGSELGRVSDLTGNQKI
ncbi:hypothetical protein Pst134EA_014918 [Puccinia striiformis f. sp. tritici]|uniref:hypothetical protein n=1 Tax=Puccinia striiformis f. sp. tritici TaxID=168172 RepID=UPI002008C49F|nr:hypothetical protein Pst134EA_014918 [Puccinia striiformis f. sp. tritici]KAH9462827.1 hypothetical protein Pst134EA_014918 [Puccinia striiformis f. sp. tritici]